MEMGINPHKTSEEEGQDLVLEIVNEIVEEACKEAWMKDSFKTVEDALFTLFVSWFNLIEQYIFMAPK